MATEEKKTADAPAEETQQSPKKSVNKKDAFADYDYDALDLSMEALLKAGAHFGHQKSRRNPKMDQYIYGVRNGITIIDLAQTVPLMEEALKFLASVRQSGKKVLFVGTKKQTYDLVVSAANATDNPYVIERWLGGTFTNFPNIRKRTRHLLQMEEAQEQGELKKYTKFEQMKKKEEISKLERKMGGIKNMTDLPGAIFVTDLKEDHLAVKEARAMNVPIVAIADANINPDDADYPIPANDDAISSLRYILAHVCKTLGAKEATK